MDSLKGFDLFFCVLGVSYLDTLICGKGNPLYFSFWYGNAAILKDYINVQSNFVASWEPYEDKC